MHTCRFSRISELKSARVTSPLMHLARVRIMQSIFSLASRQQRARDSLPLMLPIGRVSVIATLS